MTTAFVTGATGLLGSNLVAALCDAGFAVRALVRSSSKARAQITQPSVEIVPGDMTDVAAFANSLRGVDVVFHTAAYFRDSLDGGRHADALERVNVVGTRALLEAAYAAGVRRFVQTSSIAVVEGTVRGAPVDESMRRPIERAPNDYYRSKIRADDVVDAFLAAHPDFWATFVLPGFMNGPGDAGPTHAARFLIDYARGALPGVVDGTFAYVDARDVAAAEIAAASRGRRGERYLVAGRKLHMRDAMAVVERVSGRRAPTRALPTFVVGAVALMSELWARLTGRPVLLSWTTFRTMRRESPFQDFDSSKARRELGVTFRPLEETFADALRWLGDRGLLAS